ncbi:RNA-guided endonuclease InsQ/TnpB family protein [Coleofasciculus sp. H7-2]|uniref:RNA-guided endonuclease InsQ/TnpB family protein n=1 Tax=Coleofasciculus sp. H7-2 TaxID=3351545 RepID=UPI00366CBED9
MESTITLVCFLNPTPEQADKIDALLQAFADGCNYTNQEVDSKITNKATIQTLVYRDLRAKFGLSSNQAVRVCARVGANRKTAKSKGAIVEAFSPTSADYDARIFSFREKDWTASLTLLGVRERFKLMIGNYQRGKLKGKNPTSATLCKHRDSKYYLHICVDILSDDPLPSGKVIGVDLGRRDIAVMSTGQSFSGKPITEVRDRHSRVRASLQQKRSKGTRTTRRRVNGILQRLSGREKRFQAWVNHSISKKIVSEAVQTASSIALEDLTGIRERTNEQPRNKTERRRSNSWAFHQLRTFIQYKAVIAGVKVDLIPPAYTSQTCAKCLHIGLRSGKTFKCRHCGNHDDADANGAKMIELWGCAVNQPRGSEILSCRLDEPGLLKAYTIPA